MHITKSIGDIAELKVAAKYIEKGFIVSKPLTDHAPYDLLIDKEGTILRVQVKARSISSGTVTVQNFTTSREYSSNDFDLFAVYCIDTGDIAEIKKEDFTNTTLSLRVEKTKNNQSLNVKMFSEYTI